jgi:phosphoribosylglycinamide formyltransferase-1
VARVVILASGDGSNCQALIDATAESRLHAEIVGVVTNVADAGVRLRAQKAGIPDVVTTMTGLVAAIDRFRPDLVVLAGWMRLLDDAFCARYKIVNLHPALPGELPGLHAIERAFQQWEAGERDHSGVMVHWVPDAGIDDGPVVATTAVSFVEDDTIASFAARMHEAEHELIVRAVAMALTDEGASV